MKKIIFFSLVSVFLLYTCSDKKTERNISGYFPMNNVGNLDNLNRPKDSTTLYFPSYELETLYEKRSGKSLSLVFTRLASLYLYDLKEPKLSSKFLGKRMYRLFYVGESQPKSIRLIKKNGKVDVNIKYADFIFNYGPVKLVKEINFSISQEYWDTLSTLAKRARMWNVPSTTREDNSYLGFFIEGHSEYGYTHLGRARVTEGINAKETYELKRFFDRVEKMKRIK